MHFLDGPFRSSLGAILLPSARFEHQAIHASAELGYRAGPIQFTSLHYQQMGYGVLKQTQELAFLERGDHRIELILPAVPEHVGFVFPYGDEGLSPYLDQLNRISGSVGWSLIEREDDPTTRSFGLFRHLSTGLVLQILHRAQPLFRGVKWGEEAARLL